MQTPQLWILCIFLKVWNFPRSLDFKENGVQTWRVNSEVKTGNLPKPNADVLINQEIILLPLSYEEKCG